MHPGLSGELHVSVPPMLQLFLEFLSLATCGIL